MIEIYNFNLKAFSRRSHSEQPIQKNCNKQYRPYSWPTTGAAPLPLPTQPLCISLPVSCRACINKQGAVTEVCTQQHKYIDLEHYYFNHFCLPAICQGRISLFRCVNNPTKVNIHQRSG